jgi:hypothetical protein
MNEMPNVTKADRIGEYRHTGEHRTMLSALLRAFVVLAFFVVLALHAATGFLKGQFEQPYPRAMRGIDGIIETLFVGPFGQIGGASAIVIIGLLCAWLAFRRGLKGN